MQKSSNVFQTQVGSHDIDTLQKVSFAHNIVIAGEKMQTWIVLQY